MSRPIKIIVGIILIIIGILALVTPFTPGSWLAFVGLELLGIRVAFWEKIKGYILKKNDQTPTSNEQSNHK